MGCYTLINAGTKVETAGIVENMCEVLQKTGEAWQAIYLKA